jgi:hypothetical protein
MIFFRLARSSDVKPAGCRTVFHPSTYSAEERRNLMVDGATMLHQASGRPRHHVVPAHTEAPSRSGSPARRR